MYDDPFFLAHQQQLQRINDTFRQPFGMMGSPFMAVTDGERGQHRDRQMRGNRQVAMADPFGHSTMFNGMFGNMHQMMNDMMSNMHSQMNVMSQQQPDNPGNGHFYTHSSVMSYSNDGSGRPKVYQASSSTTQAAGGIKETRKTLRDSEQGIEKMSVGHHIRDRAYVQTKERTRAGDMNEEEELVNLDDTEKDSFEREWRERTRPYSARHHRAVGSGRGTAAAAAGGRSQATYGGDRNELSYRPSALANAKPRQSKMYVKGESRRTIKK